MVMIGPRTCPHCLVDNTSFRSIGREYAINRLDKVYIALFQCQLCENPVSASFTGGSFETWFSGNSPLFDTKIVDVWPDVVPNSAPGSTPTNIGRFFVQGLNALARSDYDAAGTMFRKSLDITVKVLHPTGTGNLYKRISSIPPEIGVTPAMKEWAHIIRDEGNDAAHEDEPYGKDEAIGLEAFTKLFLTYAFTLPGMVEKLRSETDSESPAETE